MRGESLTEQDLSRREVLALAGGGIGALAAGKAVDNVLIGYGDVVGTNLLEQDLAFLASQHVLNGTGRLDVANGQLLAWDTTLRGKTNGTTVFTVDVTDVSQDVLRRLDREHGFEGAVVRAGRDLRDLARGNAEWTFSTTEPFFDRVQTAHADGDVRPATVGVLRSHLTASSDLVERFTGADPARLEAVVHGLIDGFREHAPYDAPRYVAGSVEDNVLLGALDLRRYFEEDVDFATLLREDGTGLFCYEYTNRSIEALQAVSPFAQRAPVFAGSVHDRRHKHVYTVIASAIREDGQLVLPATFVDYTHTTLYAQLGLRGLLGEGLEAYNDRHRATAIYW